MSETSGVSVRRRRSRIEAERLVLEFKRSGLTRQAFCALLGLSVAALDKYRRRPAVSLPKCGRLLPVELVPDKSSAFKANSTLWVELSGGRRIGVAYLWQYGSPDGSGSPRTGLGSRGEGSVVFDFRMSRDREGPARFLDNFDGVLQTDGYAAYDHDIGGSKMVHAACWAHARGCFIDAVKLNKQDAAAVRIIALMDELFAIDARARDAKMETPPAQFCACTWLRRYSIKCTTRYCP
jgi:hypothetical protein